MKILYISDLDGTLLDSRGEISQENLDAIHELASCGIPVVPASGRSYSEMPEILRTNPDIRSYIYSNGAAVLDTDQMHLRAVFLFQFGQFDRLHKGSLRTHCQKSAVFFFI